MAYMCEKISGKECDACGLCESQNDDFEICQHCGKKLEHGEIVYNLNQTYFCKECGDYVLELLEEVMDYD